jgi:DnaA family protein
MLGECRRVRCALRILLHQRDAKRDIALRPCRRTDAWLRCGRPAVRQLVLDLTHPPQPTLGNFAAGHNGEALAALARLLAGDLHAPSLYLWGPAGAGKTHLLRAAVHAAHEAEAQAVLCGPDAPPAAGVPPGALVAVDDVDRLNDAAQAVLFSLLNRPAEEAALVLLAGSVAPAALGLRPDVRTRVGAGLALQLHLLSDDDKVQALRAHARERGFDLPTDAARYLLRHVRRDLPSLMRVLDAVDALSLQAQRPVTTALLREVLQGARLA